MSDKLVYSLKNISCLDTNIDFHLFFPTDTLILFSQWFNPNINWLSVAPLLIIIFLLIVFSALVSGSEVAFFSLNPNQLGELRRQEGVVSQRIVSLLQKPRYLLAAILIANNIFNIAIALISQIALTQIFASGSWVVDILITVAFVTFMLVLFGEVLPKVYATHNNIRLAFITAVPLSVINRLCSPVSTILVRSTSLLEKRLDELSSRYTSIKEIDQAIDLVATHNGQKSKQDIQILKGLVKFGDISVSQIMQSRLSLFSIPNTLSFNELRKKVIENGYSRVPVYVEDVDHIAGILYVKDLLEYLNQADNFEWQKLLRKPFFVPETKKIDDLLRDMQQKRVHLALVVDEYGGTSGLITLEDILEEIVGDIRDEYDTDDDTYFQKINTNNYVIDSKIMLHDACKLLKINPKVFDNVKGDADSLAGLLLEIAGKFPKKNEKIQYNRFTFTVLTKEEENKRIGRVKVSILPDAASENT